MSLPELEWQIAYARVAWAVVMAALLSGGAAWTLRPARTVVAAAMLVALAAAALPGPASPVHWLGLAFQAPSVLTVTLCASVLLTRWRGDAAWRALTVPLASAIAVAGTVLYIDASGWWAMGLYFAGFAGQGGAAGAALLGLLCVVLVGRGQGAAHAGLVLAATVTYMVLRLPTGNLWDTVLDPFLWCASLVVLARAVRQWQRAGARATGPERVSTSR